MPVELALHTISTRHLDELSRWLVDARPGAGAAAGPNGTHDGPGTDPPLPGAARRLYFGSEFCTHLLPLPSELETALRFARDRALPLTLVTPYGGDELLDKLEKLLPALPHGSEIVANDWGVLRRVARDGRFTPVMGRMLSKLMRDPWVKREWNLAPESRETTVQMPHLLMESLGVTRAETDALPGGSFAPVDTNGYDLSVYLPWSPLGSGRVCFAGSFGRGRSPRFGVMDECSRPCRHVHIRLDDATAAYGGPAATDPAATAAADAREVSETYLAGNTMLYRHPEVAVRRAIDALPGGVTRVVWEPWIPA
jgi:hypothetical protein